MDYVIGFIPLQCFELPEKWPDFYDPIHPIKQFECSHSKGKYVQHVDKNDILFMVYDYYNPNDKNKFNIYKLYKCVSTQIPSHEKYDFEVELYIQYYYKLMIYCHGNNTCSNGLSYEGPNNINGTYGNITYSIATGKDCGKKRKQIRITCPRNQYYDNYRYDIYHNNSGSNDIYHNNSGPNENYFGVIRNGVLYRLDWPEIEHIICAGFYKNELKTQLIKFVEFMIGDRSNESDYPIRVNGSSLLNDDGILLARLNDFFNINIKQLMEKDLDYYDDQILNRRELSNESGQIDASKYYKNRNEKYIYHKSYHNSPMEIDFTDIEGKYRK